jgi:hypothetical protein
MKLTINKEVEKTVTEKIKRSYDIRLVRDDDGLDVMCKTDGGTDWYVGRFCLGEDGLLEFQTYSGIEDGDGIAVANDGTIRLLTGDGSPLE